MSLTPIIYKYEYIIDMTYIFSYLSNINKIYSHKV